MNERTYSAPSGIPALITLVVLLLLDGAWLINSIQQRTAWAIVVAILTGIALLIALTGFFTVAPNEGKVLQFFGRYVGTVRDSGPRWTNPFYSKRGVSLRVRNFESSKLKVNDLDGNPIEIAAVVVWRVADTAEAVFQVDNYENFLRVQSEAAIRNLASRTRPRSRRRCSRCSRPVRSSRHARASSRAPSAWSSSRSNSSRRRTSSS